MKKFIRALIILSLLMSTTICYGGVFENDAKKEIGYFSIGGLEPFANVFFSSKCKEEEMILKGDISLYRSGRRAYQFSNELEIKIDGEIYSLPRIGRVKVKKHGGGNKTTSASYYINKGILGKILDCKTIDIKVSYSMADPTLLKIPSKMRREWNDVIINTFVDVEREYGLSLLTTEASK